MTNFEVEKQEWWVERWLDLLNSYRFKKRLERGRSYAREGNVLTMDFADSKAKATVQGSDAEPYRVSISLDSFSKEDWNFAIAKMSEKAVFTAQLLAGEMPESIEAVFTKSGLSLFPFTLNEVRSRCSCPDKANPCKHIAAVYYQLGDRFSEDPFIIFQLRGRTKSQIIERLRQIRSQAAVAQPVDPTATAIVNAATNAGDKTSATVKGFWQYNEPLESSLVAIVPPSEQKNVLDILGKMPLPPDESEAVQQYLKEIYQNTGQQALMSALNRA
ncbi:SWIM zinc finger family protein [Waterburya agarophytonicola K14]|uniref:SWIM zinc finger family protein n=1 Tax=Waterburya agarophytonicola KI4 TaxID=2874699 RepID=A0A964BR08_9CYAN|nr:SWIM zinc finger family protein [Waterburya agarophytonicola]MCC0176225.1 SWIM zinc finger family protein [Waterburya agarophytonicola KI4]